MSPIRFTRTVATLGFALLATAGAVHADDNNVAHRLLKQGNPAQAAELFTNPAWKGVAMYRSGQWWRAAEAFVRANNVESLYNLGNAYVKLGYFSLALEAYLAVLATMPEHVDAKFNADLMREIISRNNDNQGAAGLTPKAKEIDRVEEDEEKKRDGGQQSDNGDDEQATQSDADTDRKDKTTESEDQQTGQTASSGGNNESRDAQREQNETTENRLSGRPDDREQDTTAAGGSKSAEEGDGDPTPGKRIELEKAQATRQWLNSIRDDPGEFLAKRIEQELHRRRAAGTLPPKSRDPW